MEISAEDLDFCNSAPHAARAKEAVVEGCHCSCSAGPDRDPWEGKGLKKGILLLSCCIFSWGGQRHASRSFPLARPPCTYQWDLSGLTPWLRHHFLSNTLTPLITPHLMGTFQTYQERPGDPEQHIHENRTGVKRERREEKKKFWPQFTRWQQMFVTRELCIFSRYSRQRRCWHTLRAVGLAGLVLQPS